MVNLSICVSVVTFLLSDRCSMGVPQYHLLDHPSQLANQTRRLIGQTSDAVSAGKYARSLNSKSERLEPQRVPQATFPSRLLEASANRKPIR